MAFIFLGVALLVWLYIYNLVPETRENCFQTMINDDEVDHTGVAESDEHVAQLESSINNDVDAYGNKSSINRIKGKLQKSVTYPPCCYSARLLESWKARSYTIASLNSYIFFCMQVCNEKSLNFGWIFKMVRMFKENFEKYM